jgi:hypothetical protein
VRAAQAEVAVAGGQVPDELVLAAAVGARVAPSEARVAPSGVHGATADDLSDVGGRWCSRVRRGGPGNDFANQFRLERADKLNRQN